MKISTKFISVLFISALSVSLVFAQGGGAGGGGGRQGGGQGRGGQRGGQMSELQLLNRKDVQTDLGLTEAQVTKITDYAAANRGNRGGAGGGAGAGGNGGGGNGGGGQRGGGAGGGAAQTDEQRAAAAKAAAERRDKTRKDLLEIISEAQLKRVDEIGLQLQGNMAITQADVQKALAMTEDQIAKIKDLSTKQRAANTALFQKVTAQEMTREELTAAMKTNTDRMKDELGKIMTADQAAKLKTMQGKAFTADPPPSN